MNICLFGTERYRTKRFRSASSGRILLSAGPADYSNIFLHIAFIALIIIYNVQIIN